MEISKISSVVSNIALVIGVMIAVKIGYDRVKMPNVCPISSNNGLVKIAIVLLLISVVMSFLTDYLKKKNNLGNNK